MLKKIKIKKISLYLNCSKQTTEAKYEVPVKSFTEIESLKVELETCKKKLTEKNLLV